MSNKSEITLSKSGKFQILKIKGKVDAEASPALSSTLNTLIAKGEKWIVLDFSGVTFISSAGIGVTVKVLNDTRGSGGDLRLAAVPTDVKKVYELLGFAAAFNFFRTSSEAVNTK